MNKSDSSVQISDMTDMTVEEFAKALASGEPVPGGGGASALSAALAAALGSMVANLTSGKKKYEEFQEELEMLLPELEKYRNRMLGGIMEDAAAFLPLSEAYSLPRDTEEQRKYRDKELERLLDEAAVVPLELMNDIIGLLNILDRLSIIGSRLAISDIGVAVCLCKAAVYSAAFNVYINAGLMNNKDRAEELNRLADDTRRDCHTISEKIYERVMNSCRK